MLLSALVVLTIWFVACVAAGGGTEEAGLNDALLNEGSFGILFGALGTGAAYLLRESRGR